jgi:type I restriction enzyme S subunit
MIDELPQGWASLSIAELFDFKYGKGLPQEKRDMNGSVNVYGSNGVVGVHSAAVTRGPTIIVGRKGSVGEVHLSPEGCWPIDTTYFIDEFPDKFPPTYWALYLKSLRLGQQEKSSAIPGISRDDIYAVKVSLPPVDEQWRIVAKLEKLLGKVDANQQRLAKIPVLLKRFRQAVLAAACSGRLTADWREENMEIEAGASLLTRINEARLKVATSTKEKNQIAEAFQDERLAVEETELGFGAIPDSWIACRIGAIGTVANGSTPSRKQDNFWGSDIPWVSSGEVRNNIITATREGISKAGYDSCSVRLLPRGTVLLAMIGEGKTRGQSAILQIDATINQNIAAIIIAHGLVSSEFLWRWFQLQYEATRERGSGSGPQALNCQRVRELPFVLPPLREQQEVVRRVKELFALAEQIEARYAKAAAHVERLPQSILAKAFRGELVPQDPNDEPASVLLERIRQGNLGAAPNKRKRNALVTV